MVNNIYEQIVNEYYELEGYLTRSNIRGARNTEIDLIAIKYNRSDDDYEVIWAEVTGKGRYLKKDQILSKFSSDLEKIVINLTGKKPKKIFYVYILPEESICNEVREEREIFMTELDTILKSFIKIARRNVEQGRFPYSPAAPLRSLLQTLIDMKFLE